MHIVQSSLRHGPGRAMVLALCALTLALAACGGGGGSDSNAVAVSGAQIEAGAQSKELQSPRKAVLTPADIARAREAERDRPAPIDRGDVSVGPDAAAAAAAAAAAPQAAGAAGLWSAPIGWPINAIHAVLTPDGKVMSYGTDPSGAQGAQLYYDVWNPATQAHSLLKHSTGTDLFCNAQVVLPTSGQVLLAGGDIRGLNVGRVNAGVRDVNLFDPFMLTLLASGTPMAFERWYGSLVPLSDGRVLAAAGIDANGGGSGPPEVYTPGQGWQTLSGIGSWPGDWFYPRGVLAPNGQVVVASNSALFAIQTAGNGSIVQVGTLPSALSWDMPWALFDRGKMLMVGTDGSAMVVDINSSPPVARAVPGPGTNRIWGSTTVLPDGKVLVTGGSGQGNETVNVAYGADIWNPATEAWTSGATAQKFRLYHSTALLLPDATVLSAGGGSPGPAINLNAEIYSPPYLFAKDGSNQRLPRPLINSAPASVTLGAGFRISVASQRQVRRVTLVRTGSVTHSTNFEQRFVELPFTQMGKGSRVDVTLNEGPNVVPAGHYMLFVIDDAGVPSVAKIIRITNPQA
jgi:hypothetical protein